jgi:hypothetical protein
LSFGQKLFLFRNEPFGFDASRRDLTVDKVQFSKGFGQPGTRITLCGVNRFNFSLALIKRGQLRPRLFNRHSQLFILGAAFDKFGKLDTTLG